MKEKININRPQDYKFRSIEAEIKSFAIDESDFDSYRRLIVNYITKDGIYKHELVSLYGEYHAWGTHSKDVVLKNKTKQIDINRPQNYKFRNLEAKIISFLIDDREGEDSEDKIIANYIEEGIFYNISVDIYGRYNSDTGASSFDVILKEENEHGY